jgi:polyhydroxybutyrate depolymerase
MSGKDWKNCNPSQKIPVLQISGTNDTTVPWDGTMSTAYGWGGAPHIQKVMDFWADLNSTTKTEKIDFPDIESSDKSTASLTKRTDGINGNEVWFYTISGGGHDWPGSWGNKDISASQEIWKFFKKHLK